MIGPSARGPLAERLGKSLRGRPYGWTAGTFVLLTVVWSSLATAVTDADHHAWADWVTLGSTAYGVVAALGLVPRVVVPRLRPKASRNRIALLRWAFALAPFVIAIGTSAAGAHAWAIGIAIVATALLLAHTAATIDR